MIRFKSIDSIKSGFIISDSSTTSSNFMSNFTSLSSIAFSIGFRSMFFFNRIAVLRDVNAFYLTVRRVSDSNSFDLSFSARILMISWASWLLIGILAALSIKKSAFFSILNIFVALSLNRPILTYLFLISLRYLNIWETLGLGLLSTIF